jgi:hypothetical protein
MLQALRCCRRRGHREQVLLLEQAMQPAPERLSDHTGRPRDVSLLYQDEVHIVG